VFAASTRSKVGRASKKVFLVERVRVGIETDCGRMLPMDALILITLHVAGAAILSFPWMVVRRGA